MRKGGVVGSIRTLTEPYPITAQFPLSSPGIAVPQAPMNRSEPEVQKDIHDYLAVRIEARLMALMASGR